MIPLIPVALVLGLGGAAAAKKWRKQSKGLTPERKVIYETALEELTDPVKLNGLADAFDEVGLKVQAKTLRKRAGLRGRPESAKVAQLEAFRRGMASQNVDGVRELANAFESMGAFVTAKDLRKYADGLQAGQAGVSETQTAESAEETVTS